MERGNTKKERRQVIGKKQDFDVVRTKTIETLESTIFISALLSAKQITEEWPSVTSETTVSWKSDWIVRLEILWFLLHMMGRHAFDLGGRDVRDILQDAVVENAIRRMCTTSFDRSHVKKGVDVKELDSRIASDALEGFNEVEMDYNSCKRLGIEDRVGSSSEETVLNKLAWRISRSSGQEFTINFEFLIWKGAVESLAKSGLKKLVEKACRILRT